MKYSCVIIGLGAIGMGYDYFEDNLILTHARAISSHPYFELISAVDPSSDRRELFQRRYNIKAYACLKDLPGNTKIDLFVVCNPTKYHLPTIAMITDHYSPLCILCEKPISNNYADAQSLFKNFQSINKPKIFVNYMRRSDKSWQKISELIGCEDLGFKIKGHCYYTKGALNNASHFLNLMESWFGKSTLTALSDHYPCEIEGDFNLDFVAKFNNASIVFQSGIEAVYSLYQFQLYLSSGILTYANGGKDIFYLPSNYISDNPVPFMNPWKRIISDLPHYQYHVYDEILKELNGQPSMLSTESDALSTLESLSNLRATLS